MYSKDVARTKNNHTGIGSILNTVKSMDPGIMLAAAAVGGSHLVASTKAGAVYGWQLLGLIVLVNLFKYPFFRASVQYTVGTKTCLVEGYQKLGRKYLWIFAVLSAVGAVINTAALTMFSASLLSYFLPVEFSIQLSSVAIIVICLSILFTGHFKSLDRLSKLIMISLTVSTIAALIIALTGSDSPKAENFVSPSPWSLSALGFLVIAMGWMPAPIEISSINSIWLKRQSEERKITPKSALFDFNVGYIGTTVLAVVFLSLGALILHGTGTELASSGIKFSHQLVGLYSATIGEWSKYLVALIAFLTIFGSTITIIDGYGRALSESQRLLSGKTESSRKRNDLWMLGISLAALAVILFWAKALIPMLDFAMILAFVTTPVFALLNYILITRTNLPIELKSSKKLKALSVAGLIYLYVFLGVFIWWKWLL